MKINVIFLNKETQQEETAERNISPEEVACIYKDSENTIVTTKQGKILRVTNDFNELREFLL